MLRGHHGKASPPQSLLQRTGLSLQLLPAGQNPPLRLHQQHRNPGETLQVTAVLPLVAGPALLGCFGGVLAGSVCRRAYCITPA